MSTNSEIEKKKELIRETIEDAENLIIENIIKTAGQAISLASNNTIISKNIDDAIHDFVLNNFTSLSYKFDSTKFINYLPIYFKKIYKMRVIILSKSLNLDKIKIENIYNKMWTNNEIANDYGEDFVFNIKDFKYEYLMWNKILILTSGILKN